MFGKSSQILVPLKIDWITKSHYIERLYTQEKLKNQKTEIKYPGKMKILKSRIKCQQNLILLKDIFE